MTAADAALFSSVSLLLAVRACVIEAAVRPLAHGPGTKAGEQPAFSSFVFSFIPAGSTGSQVAEVSSLIPARPEGVA